MKTVCCWCWKEIKVSDTYDGLQHKAICSPVCKAAEMMFSEYWSDEEINRRVHYRYLTGGQNDSA